MTLYDLRSFEIEIQFYFFKNPRHNKNFNKNNNHKNNNNNNNNNRQSPKMNKQDLPENNQFYCEVCDRGFKTDQLYDEHCKTHTTVINFSFIFKLL